MVERLRHHKKVNNGGMSMIEVVVAIAILTIAILPIMYSFIHATKNNAKARVRQQTTAAAQTIMENFKAYSIEEICGQFASNDFAGVKLSSDHDIALVEPTVVELIDPSGNFIPSDNGKYEFHIKGLQYKEAVYDAKIEIKPHNSDSSSIQSVVLPERDDRYDAVYLGYERMDAEAAQGILYMITDKWNQLEIANGLVGSHQYTELRQEDIKILRRDFNVEISGDNDNQVVTVSCTYSFKAPFTYTDSTGAEIPYIMAGDEGKYTIDLTPDDAGDSLTIYNSTTAGTDAKLYNLYFYYFPAYSLSGDAEPGIGKEIKQDSITIRNNVADLGYEIRCFIYKQNPLTISKIRLSTCENAYHPEIKLEGAQIKIYDDNFAVNLGNGAELSPPVINRYMGLSTIAADLKPRSGSTDPRATLSMTDTEKQHLADETSEKLRLMSDIEIYIYPSGSFDTDQKKIIDGTEELSVLSGTIISQ